MAELAALDLAVEAQPYHNLKVALITIKDLLLDMILP
jgi:hypothetical protein